MACAMGVETSACTLVLLTLSSCVVYLGQAETTVSNTKLILKCSGYPNKRCSSLAILCYQDMFETPRRCGPLCDGMEHFSIDEEQCLDYCGDFVDKYCQLFPKTLSTTPQKTTPQLTTPQLTTLQMTTTPVTTLQINTTQINAGLTKPKVATVTAPQTTSQLTTNSGHTPTRKDPTMSQPPSSSNELLLYTALVPLITLVAVGIAAIAVIVRRQRKEKKIQKELRSNKMTKDVEKRLLGQAESSV